MDATATAAAVRAGRLTPRDAVEQALARIAALDPEIGAFVTVNGERARADADALAARADLGTLPLAGVPVAVKDNIAVAGEPTRHGSGATSPEPALADDELVRRLRDAGAVVVGKTRLPELAIWDWTESKTFGGTRNPRDPARNAGGSTGGGAAAVAAGMVPLALGSDGGGSLRIPAANCGVVGCKPGRGLVPIGGGLSEHWYGCSAYGPIAATVADTALALDILAGTTALRTLGPPDRPLRIAVSVRSPSPIGRPDAPARAAVARAAALARAAGHTVVAASPPYTFSIVNAWVRRWQAGVAQEVASLRLPVAQLEGATRAIVAKGERIRRRGLSGPQDAETWRQRALRWFDSYDVLLSPTVARPAPPMGWGLDRSYLRAYLHGARTVPYTQAWNLAALPALSLPIGGTPRRPGAVQLVAPAEATVLSLALQLEAAGAV